MQLQERLTVVRKMFAHNFPFCTIVAVIGEMLMLSPIKLFHLGFKDRREEILQPDKIKKFFFTMIRLCISQSMI